MQKATKLTHQKGIKNPAHSAGFFSGDGSTKYDVEHNGDNREKRTPLPY